MQRIPALTLLAILLLSGCATQEVVEDELAPWVGKPVSEAIEAMGRPTNVTNMQNGTWEYSWRHQKSGSVGVGTTFMGLPVSKTTSDYCNKVLVTDRTKEVISYLIEGKC